MEGTSHLQCKGWRRGLLIGSYIAAGVLVLAWLGSWTGQYGDALDELAFSPLTVSDLAVGSVAIALVAASWAIDTPLHRWPGALIGRLIRQISLAVATVLHR